MKLFNIKNLDQKLDFKFIYTRSKYIKSEKAKRRIVRLAIKNKKIDIEKHKFLISLFGCGFFKFAPGTVASILTCFIWFLFNYLVFQDKTPLFTNVFWAIIVTITFFYGIFICPFYEEFLKTEDPPSVVIDEFVGQIFALFTSYGIVKEYIFLYQDIQSIYFSVAIIHIFLCLISFRFLDIVKPSIIGFIDRNIKGGLGIMLDDLISGVFASLIVVMIFKTVFITFII
jgi:phosphatidylglycerophosphatase A